METGLNLSDPRFAGREYFTENNAYTYNWDVKHDLNGLFELMGGRQRPKKSSTNFSEGRFGFAQMEILVHPA